MWKSPGEWPEVERFFSSCDLNRQVQDIIGNYIMAEEYFMKEMIIKVGASEKIVERFSNPISCLYLTLYLLFEIAIILQNIITCVVIKEKCWLVAKCVIVTYL